MDAVASRLERGTQEGGGRTLAVGARDMKNRRQRAVRIADPAQQRRNPVEPQHVAPRREIAQPVELRLDGGVFTACMVGHVIALARQLPTRG